MYADTEVQSRLNARPVRFTGIDAFMLAFWLAFILVYLRCTPNAIALGQTMLWVFAGGAVLIASHFYSVVYKGEKSQGNLQIAAITPLFFLVIFFVHNCVTSVTPVTYDALLLRWDFGVSKSIADWQVTTWIIRPLVLVYVSLAFLMMICVGTLRDSARKRLLQAIVLGAVICPFCYLLCPAVGPAHIGDIHAPRNCMPSMHLTWMLLLWVYSNGRWKWLFGFAAFLTAWATLATGEHYVLDLVAAVLFTWGLTALVKRDRLHWRLVP